MKKLYIVLLIFFILFFFFFYYKNSKLGNTIIKLSNEKIIENILNNKIDYQAEIKVKVYSNKNENEYELKIVENKDNSLIEVIGKSNISGLKIEKKDGNLIVKNSKLKLDKIYQEYKEVTDNSLFLSSFLKEYKNANDRQIIEDENEIVIKIVPNNYTKYIKYKELYLDKSTGMPIKLVIKDSNKEIKISIEYTSIEIL